jgi:hypothetical protein
MRRIRFAVILILAFALGCMNANKKVPPPGKPSDPPPATGAMARARRFRGGDQRACGGAGEANGDVWEVIL